MIRKFKQSIIIALAFILVLPVVTFAIAPMPPILISGTVTIDGNIASSGTVSVLGVSTSVGSDGKYSIQVPSENGGETLTFKVNNKDAASQIVTGPTKKINLAITTKPAPAPSSGGGGGNAGGGGGTYTPPTPPVEDKDDQETPKIPVVKGVTTVNIFDGDIIVNPNAEGLARFDVYIVKIVGDKKFRRLILSPHVFESYGHLKWENIKEINQETMNNFAISNLVRCQDPNFEVNDPKVYQLTPNGDKGTKRWMNMSAKAFQSAGHNWNAIYIINKVDRDAYATGEEII